jgi:hypothetical protein
MRNQWLFLWELEMVVRGVLVASLFSKCDGAIMGTYTEFGMGEGDIGF